MTVYRNLYDKNGKLVESRFENNSKYKPMPEIIYVGTGGEKEPAQPAVKPEKPKEEPKEPAKEPEKPAEPEKPEEPPKAPANEPEKPDEGSAEEAGVSDNIE